jgi:hypothetical protein
MWVKVDNPENLAYLYLRLNGYFTITNFVLHPDSRGPQLTDADVLAVRFPYSKEQMMDDDPAITDNLWRDARPDLTCFLLCEVKTGLCDMNKAWKEPGRENVQRALMRFGITSDETKLSRIADKLYSDGFWYNNLYLVKRVVFGARANEYLPDGITQITWKQVASFLFDRFQIHWRIKSDHSQWESFIKDVYTGAVSSQNLDDFTAWIENDVLRSEVP